MFRGWERFKRNLPSGRIASVFLNALPYRQYHDDKTIDLKVTIPFQSSWSFKLIEESFLEQFFKSLKLLNEIQIGHEEWDKAVYIIGDAPRIRTLISQNEKLQSASLSLIRKKFVLEVTGKKIILIKKAILRSEFENCFLELKDELDSICLELDEAKETSVPEKNYDKLVFRLFVSVLFLFISGTLFLSINSVDSDVFHLGGNSGFYGFVLGGVIGTGLLILWRLIRRLHSRSHYEFLSLAIAIPLGLGICGSSSAFYLNRILDSGHGYIAVAEIGRKYSYRVKHGTVYKIVYKFKLPLEIRSKPTFKDFAETVSENEYFLLHVGDRRPLRIYAGFFGQPWVQKSTSLPSSSSEGKE